MNQFDPLDLARLEAQWGDLQVHTLTELRAAKRENDVAHGRYVAATFENIRQQRRVALLHTLKTWQPAAAAVIAEIPVGDDPEVYLRNPPVALRLAAWGAREKEQLN